MEAEEREDLPVDVDEELEAREDERRQEAGEHVAAPELRDDEQRQDDEQVRGRDLRDHGDRNEGPAERARRAGRREIPGRVRQHERDVAEDEPEERPTVGSAAHGSASRHLRNALSRARSARSCIERFSSPGSEACIGR